MTDLTYSLTEVLSTDELASRCSRPPDFERVNDAFGALLSARLYTPEAVLQKFAELLLDLCNAHSAGVSILEEEKPPGVQMACHCRRICFLQVGKHAALR
jgi:hypothetical protein